MRIKASAIAASNLDEVSGGESQMRVADIMSKQVISLMPGHSVRHAAQIMLEHGISGVPVVDDDRVVGILTEGDLLRRVELGSDGKPSHFLISPAGEARDFVRTHSWRVADVMSSPVVSVSEDMPLHEAAMLLSTRGIKRVPVLKDGQLVGILSRGNLLGIIAQSRAERGVAGEEALQRAAQARLGELKVFDALPIVTIEGHVAHLWGTVRSQAERDAARVAVESIPGLAGAEDHLTVVSSVTGGPAVR
jgi:CBS domain-containing protein